MTFLLGFLVERTGSLLLAVTIHEWVDIVADSSGEAVLFRAGIACIPVWVWLIWTWPKPQPASVDLQPVCEGMML